jgi:hypothetical protein
VTEVSSTLWRLPPFRTLGVMRGVIRDIWTRHEISKWRKKLFKKFVWSVYEISNLDTEFQTWFQNPYLDSELRYKFSLTDTNFHTLIQIFTL